MIDRTVTRGCPECGGSIPNHRTLWVSNVIAIALERFDSRTHVLSAAHAILARGKPIGYFLYKVLLRLKILTKRDNIDQAPTTRERAVWEAARARGIAMRQLFLFGFPTMLFEVEHNGRPYIFHSLPIVPGHEPNFVWADDKHTLKERLRAQAIAVPRAFSVTTVRQAKEALHNLKRVCVKPRMGSNGKHTFPHVSTERELEHAFYSAKKLCPQVVVEEHLEGNLSRATCVGGTLIGFLESKYPTVIGDGRSTVKELIEQENTNKPQRVSDIEVTPLHVAFIARRGYALDSVLENGTKLPLTYAAGRLSGGSNHERNEEIHPILRSEIERAAHATGLPVVGFDLIMEDPTKDPRKQKWGIIEANSRPWIDLHSAPLYGTPVDVAPYIWDVWLLSHADKKAQTV